MAKNKRNRREEPNARSPKDRDLAVRIARRVYIDGEPQHKVAAAEDVGVSTVSRLLKYAEDHAIVTHVIDPHGRPGVREDLGQALSQEFGLSYAIVVDTVGAPEYQPEADDRLHYHLGRALGEHLRLIVRNGDHLLTTGGRGPFFVGKHLATFHTNLNLNIRDVSVTAISGKMATQVHEPAAAFAAPSVDADDAAFFLAKAFCKDMKQLHALNRQVAYPQPDGYTHRRQDFGHLFTEEGALRNGSTLCVCGIGRLGGKHMFIQREEKKLPFMAGPITDLLELLKDYRDSADSDFFPIGDVANRLFLTREIDDAALHDKVIAKISEINQSVVGLPFTQLALVPTIIVTAGGVPKYPAIRKVLSFRKRTGEPFVSILCTDVEVAKKLLKNGPEKPTDIRSLPGEESMG